MSLLLSLIFLHLVSDFVLQSDGLVLKKRHYYLKNSKLFTLKNPLWIHGAWVFAPMQLLLFYFSPLVLVVLLSGVITLTHIALDHVKLIYDKRVKQKAVMYLLDQLVHIILIYSISSFFFIEYTEKYLPLWGSYKSINNKGQWDIPSFSNDFMAVLSILIVFSYMAGHLITYLLENFKILKIPESSNARTMDKLMDKSLRPLSDHEKKIGLRIGLIERFLVIVFVAVGQYGALGLILAGKSLARYEDLKDKAFAEYYLLGTLLSFLFGVLGGLLVHWVVG
jgi:hypothetical protein